MGHAFQQTLMDALIRYHRMRGDNTNWVVGTDHAGIATQIVVERQLEDEGKTRHDLGREEFVERVWEWKQQSGSTITRQMRRLGASANWDYADTEGQKRRLLHDGREDVARGDRSVRAAATRKGSSTAASAWSTGIRCSAPRSPTSRSTARRNDGTIWEILYPFVDGRSSRQGRQPVSLRGMTIATTRPETMLGDGAVAVHPEGRALPAPGRQAGEAAALRPHHPGHRRRLWSSASSAPAA